MGQFSVESDQCEWPWEQLADKTLISTELWIRFCGDLPSLSLHEEHGGTKVSERPDVW
jgi:hypothetical protein